MKASRRSFLIFSVGIGSSLALSGVAFGEDPKLSEADPAAQKLGYRVDASKVDKTRFPNFVAGQDCSNCSLYQGNAGETYGGCVLFGNKQVAARGWCSSYTNS
ncbi:high-potential iron-sulfur protein [Paraburkholderia sp. BL10I2N1]|uniref:high-potential iron-sulfur protein n=1 Tax=Paraburkholderia sp. BL10I2N1 TaxID=1938796 RepID=UPI00105FD749|nr:high-potential iron-sulfur protein [Paraburkholderia sp. BL10I2N1]TDN69520.1 high potential iron-sulfur protein [Paraburkholderia sp. BL10I2N1]